MPQQDQTDIMIRPATIDDLGRVYEVWYQTEIAGESEPPPRGRTTYIAHTWRTGTMLVAVREGTIVGFATSLARGRVVYLADLFIQDNLRSQGVGKMLLTAVLPTDGPIRCTMSSTDLRALALYARSGMRPRWPNIWLRGTVEKLGTLPVSDVIVHEAHPGDPDLLTWDARVSGRYRPEDHRYWVQVCAAVPVWFLRHGERVGYGYLQQRSDESLWFPTATTVGPIGALDETDALDCTCAAVHWARQRANILRVALPGPHPALPILLEAGFHITDVETFVSSRTSPVADPTCYVSSGSGLF